MIAIIRTLAIGLTLLSGPACRTAGSSSSIMDDTDPASTLPTNLWADATAATIGETDEWSNKVDLGDVNGDGLVDIAFANGGNYSSPGDLEPTRIMLNKGPGLSFKDA